MLSATYSVTDVKTTLRNSYSDFGFTSELEYTQTIENSFGIIKLSTMYPYIGEDAYTIIKDKDKVGLDTTELQIYWSEIYFVCADVLNFKDSFAISTSSESTSSESLSVEGYSYSSSASAGTDISGSDMAAAMWKGKARLLLIRAGYNINTLQKTSTMFEGTYDC